MAVNKPEDLQKENEILRKENAELRNRNEILMIQNLYLKKLDALAAERENRKKKKSHRQ